MNHAFNICQWRIKDGGLKNYNIQYILPNIRFPECILRLIFLKTVKSPESKNYNFQYILFRFPKSILGLVFLQFQDHQIYNHLYYRDRDGDNCQHAMLLDAPKFLSSSNMSVYTATERLHLVCIFRRLT